MDKHSYFNRNYNGRINYISCTCQATVALKSIGRFLRESHRKRTRMGMLGHVTKIFSHTIDYYRKVKEILNMDPVNHF